jgi:hypothetical protein
MDFSFKFSEWIPWATRKGFCDAGKPGVYLLAHFDQAPTGPADPLTKEILYIGETCKRTFAKRWREFDYSARTGLKRHSGGRTYHSNKKNKLERLFVAAYMPESKIFPDLKILFVERKALLDYALQYKSLPACNKK